jgi:hypothetical protein
MIFGGGTTPVTGKTEFWDGSSWTEIGDMSTARGQQAASDGTSSDAIVAGGNTGSYSAATEEWTAPATFTKQIEGQLFFNSTANAFKETITDLAGGAWASAPTLNTARSALASAGNSQDDVLAIAGSDPSANSAVNEKYNGTAWTEVGDIPTATANGGGIGITTAALYVSGQTGVPYSTDVYSWDGSSWTDGTDTSSRHAAAAAFGLQSAGVIASGRDAPNAIQPAVESWNGSSWTEVAEMNESRRFVSSGGTQTAGLAFSGCPNTPPSPNAKTDKTETWNGTSWTEVGDLNTSRFGGLNNGGVGTQTSSMMAGGNQVPPTTGVLTETWDGTSWTERADLSTGRNTSAGAGAGSPATIAFGGTTASSNTNASEEFTAPLANKTITAS